MGNASGHWNGQGFFVQDPKSTGNKSEIDKWNYIKLKCFCTVKKTMNRME
jgi:hypothetical protein